MAARYLKLASLTFALLLVLTIVPQHAEAKRKACKTGHFHHGAGELYKSKRKALRSAVAYWADFTASEYGSAWASYRRASSKSKRCYKSDDGKNWQCFVWAIPCRA